MEMVLGHMYNISVQVKQFSINFLWMRGQTLKMFQMNVLLQELIIEDLLQVMQIHHKL